MFLIDDFLQAWRGLARSPGFLALTAGVLALGLGSTTFMHGAVVTIAQKPPPFERADRLYLITAAEPARGIFDGQFHYLDYLELKAQQRTFEDIAGSTTGSMTLSGQGVPSRVMGAWVTSNFFQILGVRPMLGRVFTAADSALNAAPVVIVGYDLWRTRFNADPKALGKTVRINGEPTTIIGIAPREFSFPFTQEVWVPIATSRGETPRGSSNSVRLQLVGRLRDGVTEAQALDDLAAGAARLAKQYPETNAGTTANLMPVAISAVGVLGSRLLYVIFGCVWLVLLIACTNVASLCLVRANTRAYEAAMRVALGARRVRLIAQMLAESVIVSFVAVLGGLAIAALALRGLKVGLPAIIDRPLPSWWQFTIDTRVAAVAALAALLCGLLAGVVPALRASRPDVMRILRDGARTGTGIRWSRFASVMVVIEIALSAVLLTSAGLLTRDAMLALQRDIGVDTVGFMSGRVGVPNYSLEESGRFYERLLGGLAARPGVQAVAAASAMPGLGAEIVPYMIEGRHYATRRDMPRAQDVAIMPGFFRAFGLRIVSGRDFDSRDRFDTLPVALVNETFVRTHFATQSPLGKRVRVSTGSDDDAWLTIVGVVPDVQHATQWAPGGQFHPAIYTPASQKRAFLTVAVKGSGDPHGYAHLIRETVQSLDPDVAVYFLRTLVELQASERGTFRILAILVASFAGIAVVLSAAGTYGVLAFATRQRTREIGVRRALGAHDRQILQATMRSAIVQLAIGLAVAAVLCPLVPRALSGALQGLPADDPGIYAVVFGVLIVAVLLASWVPALRALQVQPAVALRNE